MHVVLLTCRIPDIANRAGNRTTSLFAESQGLGEIEDFGFLEINNVPNMIKAHNSTPGQVYFMVVVLNYARRWSSVSVMM